MSKLLDQIGEKLNDAAEKKQLSIVDLDIKKPTIKGNHFLDTIILYLMKPMNSMFLVTIGAS